MAYRDFFKGNALLIVAGAVILVLIATTAFLIGQRNAPVPAPSATGAGATKAKVHLVRLPPQKFDNWVLNCLRGPRGGQRCGLGLSVVDQSRTRVLFKLDVLKAPKGPALVAVTPPGSLLTAGFTITPEKAQAVTMPFTRCMPRACEAVYLMSDALRSALGSASTARIHYIVGNGRAVDLQIPIKGFEAGYAALQTQDTTTASAAPATVRADGSPNSSQGH